jgi:hypothetical protein
MVQALLEPPRLNCRPNAVEVHERTVVNVLWNWCKALVTYLNLRFTHDGGTMVMLGRLRSFEDGVYALEQRVDALEREKQLT